MFSESAIASDLIAAYLATDYRVDAMSPFVLRIGQPSLALAQLYAKHRCNCGAYMTACNPFSQIFDGQDNAQRQAALLEELTRRSLGFVGGVAEDPQGRWPGEPSFLILGLDHEAAKALGRWYDQNALVWCGPDVIPQLVLL